MDICAFGVILSATVTGTPSHSTYRGDIEGLRGVAVLVVVAFHAAPSWMTGGFIGVDVFFTISGFLISTILFVNLERGTFSYTDFYDRRVRRLFPALIVICVACFALGWFVLPVDQYESLGKHAAAGAAFSSNFVLWRESGYFLTAAATKPLLHLWSLAIEEQFYLLWPLLVVVAWKRHWNVLAVTGTVAFISFVFNIVSARESPHAVFYSPVARFWELMIGCALAYLVLHRPAALSKHHNARSIVGASLLGLGLALINSHRAFPSWWALLPTFGTTLLISAGANSWINRAVLGNRVIRWFGAISYPLYLWHWPLLVLALCANNTAQLSREVRVGISLASVLLAWLTFKLLEQPVRERRMWSTRYLVAALSVIGLVGVLINATKGVPARAINRNEVALFLMSYRTLENSIGQYYGAECDFYDRVSGANKGAISKDCTEVNGHQAVYLIWGDSYAQALSYGLRNNAPAGVKMAQITTSACRPKLYLDPDNGYNKSACRASNDYAIDFIKHQKPAKVFVAQSVEHEATNWEEMARFVRAQNGTLILFGPMPRWRPSLPLVVARNLAVQKEYVGDGLDTPILEVDERLKRKYTNSSVGYISLVDRLCRANECKALVDTSETLKLLVFDDGHLTPAGSDHVVRQIASQAGLQMIVPATTR